MVGFLLLSLFLGSVLCAPSLSNDFTSTASIIIVTNEELDELNGLYAVDNVGGRQRISASARVNGTVDRLDVWKYYDNVNGGWEHENRKTGCTSRQFTGEKQGIWDWLSEASSTGNCTMASNGGATLKGQKWSFSYTEGNSFIRYDACISIIAPRIAIPLWSHFTSSIENWLTAVTLVFDRWTPGTPDKALFEVPSNCKKTNVITKRTTEEAACNCGGKSRVCTPDGKFCVPCPCFAKKRTTQETSCNCGGKSQICTPDGEFCVPCPCFAKKSVEEIEETANLEELSCSCGGKSQLCSPDGKFCVPCPCFAKGSVEGTEDNAITKRSAEAVSCNCGGKSKLCTPNGRCVPCPCFVKRNAENVEETFCNCGGKSKLCTPDGRCVPCPCK